MGALTSKYNTSLPVDGRLLVFELRADPEPAPALRLGLGPGLTQELGLLTPGLRPGLEVVLLF